MVNFGVGKYLLVKGIDFYKAEKIFEEKYKPMKIKKWKSIYKENHYAKYGFKAFEHSFSRIWQHRATGFFIISAFRSIYTEDQNLERHKNLKRFLQGYKLGFFELDGVYKYEDGTEDSELSLFVPLRPKEYNSDIFKDIAVNAGRKFNQESILYKYPEDESNEYV